MPFLPSLEHKRFSYPRPRPTILSPASTSAPKTTQNKGKGREKTPTPSISDWQPEAGELDDSHSEGDVSQVASAPPSPSATLEKQGTSPTQKYSQETNYKR